MINWQKIKIPRELKFIAAPIIIFIILGVILECANFYYLHSTIIAFATIQSALIAIYISKTKEHNDEINRLENRKLILEHFITLIEKGIEAIEKETNNYREFCEELRNEGLGRLAMKTTPFFLLERASDEISGELFKAITENRSKGYKQTYLEIIKGIHHALFLKKLAEDQYFRFIKNFNIQAEKLTTAQKSFNNYYRKIMHGGDNNNFKNDLHKIVVAFNKDYSDNLPQKSKIERKLVGLKNILVNQIIGSQYFNDLAVQVEEYDLPLSKIDEINKDTEDHFKGIINEMTDIVESFKENLTNISR